MQSTNLLIIITAIAIFIAIFILVIYLISKNKLQELSEKTSHIVNGDELNKIEFEASGVIGIIAQNFNTLGTKYNQAKKNLNTLSSIEHDKNLLDSKLNLYETSISQINLLTDIGRDITSSLNVDEIIQKLYKYISSSMVLNEMYVLLHQKNKSLYLSIKDNKIEDITNLTWSTDTDNPINWCFINNKEMELNDAQSNYSQYVFNPITYKNGEKAASVISIPLSLSNKMIGSICIMSDSINAYDTFHLEFLKSVSSYLSVAHENSGLFEDLNTEKKKSDELLLNILPSEIAEELKQTGGTKARLFENVTVLFTDFVNFTGIGEKLSPTELVDELHKNFTAFDAISEKHGLEKIKTIGDAYLAVCGLPNEIPDHAHRVAKAAIEIQDYIKKSKSIFQIRIGIHSGSVVAGIVGSKKFAYDIWGDTVNTASRMESNSEAGKTNISSATNELIKDDFKCTYRGKIAAKNKGEIDMYFVE